MRRLWRISRGALTILSLLLALAFAGLWVRSYWRADVFGWRAPVRSDAEFFGFNAVSAGGGTAVWLGYYAPRDSGDWPPDGWDWNALASLPPSYADGGKTNRFGMTHESFTDPAGRWRRIVFPTWLAALAFAPLPGIVLTRAIRRRRRVREGHCRKCGYDLRATPDRCPECGHVPAGAIGAGAA
jgi:hypothetical protein